MPNADSIRSGLHSWIDTLDLDMLLRVHQFRRALDPNMRKPSPPDGWVSLRRLASETLRNHAHLSRNATAWAAAGHAGLFLSETGHIAWYISPTLAADIRTAAEIRTTAASRQTPSPTTNQSATQSNDCASQHPKTL